MFLGFAHLPHPKFELLLMGKLHMLRGICLILVKTQKTYVSSWFSLFEGN